jgi:hypothetical protein
MRRITRSINVSELNSCCNNFIAPVGENNKMTTKLFILNYRYIWAYD